jgi:DNA repair exonuclease SbcCD ATPase subunit
MNVEYQWISVVRKACLALAMTLAATHAWAEKVAEYNFRTIIAKDKAAIDQIQEQLKAGADFGTLAMERSTDRNSAKDGGLMKYARANSLHSVVVAELESLQPGQRSAQPRNSPFGWFVIKLESVTMVEDDTAQRMQAHKERAEKLQLDRERREKDMADYEEAKARFEEDKAKFESCARTAVDLEGESKDLNRRIELFNQGARYSASELRSEQVRLNQKVSVFERDCSQVAVNDEITKVCSHPAYQSRWCSSFR